MKLTFVALVCAVAILGCADSLHVENKLNDIYVEPASPHEVKWHVSGDGKFLDGEILLAMEHGTIEETGEPFASDTYGLRVTDGERTMYLLWTKSPENPYRLKAGDEFRFAKTILERNFDEYNNGYHARAEDIVIEEY